jgi:LAO/AO transport system kinase
MATRGSLGGLATTSKEVADLLDAYGFDRVITETVGVGQSELEIAGTADTTVVVLVPESGDSIQAMKAGLMEIADIFVINKADRPGADRLAQELEVMLHMRLGEAQPAAAGHHGVSLRSVGARRASATREAAEEQGGWAIPVLKTVAQKGEGLEELARPWTATRCIWGERRALGARRRRLAERVRAVVERELQAAGVARRGRGGDPARRRSPRSSPATNRRTRWRRASCERWVAGGNPAGNGDEHIEQDVPPPSFTRAARRRRSGS